MLEVPGSTLRAAPERQFKNNTLKRKPSKWPSSSPKNNRCCATARAVSSATRRRCRICGSCATQRMPPAFPASCGRISPRWDFPACWCRRISAAAGLGCVEAGVVMEEIGRTLMPSPFLSTAVLAASALSRGGSAAQKAQHLPKISDGSLLAALAIDEGAKHRPLQTKLQAVRSGNGFKLTGDKAFVVDGHTADLLIVAARTAGVVRRARRIDAVSGRPQGKGHRDRAHGDGRFAQRRPDQIRKCRGQRRWRARRGRSGFRAAGAACSISAAARWPPKWSVCRGSVRPHRHLSQGAQAVRQADRRIPGAAAPRRPALYRHRDHPRRGPEGAADAGRGSSPAPARRWRSQRRAPARPRRWPSRKACRCMAAWA